MARFLAGVIALALLPAAASALGPPPAAWRARAELERLARYLRFFEYGEFAYGRLDGWSLPAATARAYRKAVLPLADRAYPEHVLLPLLKHKDARVRTVAMLALFARDDPKLLPHFVALAKDGAATFPEPQFRGGLWDREEMPALEKRTVGEVARGLVEQYLQEAGYFYGIDREGQPGFAEYWARRRGRAYCASWFAVRLGRASGHADPAPRDRRAAVRAVRREIDRLPKSDRALTLLWLRDRPGADALATERELVRACEDLGRDNLLKVLRKQPPTTDPDLQPRGGSAAPYDRARLFILENAHRLLRPGDAAELLKYEAADADPKKTGKHNGRSWPQWFIAAARLQPARAKAILARGYDACRSPLSGPEDRAKLTLARWRLVREDDPRFTVRWFYGEKRLDTMTPHCRAQFLRGLGDRPAGRDRRLLVELVRDPGFTRLDWQSLEEMARLVNRWEKAPLLAEAELRKARHPLGMFHFDRSPQEAARKYPKETAELLSRLESWRRALRKYVAKR